MAPVISLFWHFFVLVLSNAVLVLSNAVLVLSNAVLVLSNAVLVLSNAVLVLVIDTQSRLPLFDYEHEHRFTEHEHANCV